ncbi:hypothetical protein ASG36_01495 [Geodermatophilus sp. Leaf369]|uniref:hypothetical protein n=1 Tax=Geodermatophilus sp. Leaf369 TaxID=1736354 RepID=UPI0006F43BC8|nr:hypothetical protein [Geodermatophilus sp. Leaf369]KQS59751.1 hypothetical protein ASG36_01495 [Geodermatophilus sp. Leaf369]
MRAPRLVAAAAALAAATLLSGCSVLPDSLFSSPSSSASSTSAAPTSAEPTVEPVAAPVAPERPGPVTEHHGLAPAEELAFAQRVLAGLVAKQDYGYAWADETQVQETVDVATATADAVAARQEAYRASAGTGPEDAYQIDEQFIGVPVITYDADFLPVQIVGTVQRTSTEPAAEPADGTAAASTDAAVTSTDSNATDHQVYTVSLVWTPVVTADGTAVGAWVYSGVTA